MFKFTIFLALCVALFYESTALEEQELETITNELNQALQEQELQSIAKEFKKAIRKLTHAVDHAIKEAGEGLNKALHKVKSVAAELGKKATHELEKALGPLRKKLDNLVAKAKAAGFDVSKCVKYVEDFTKTPEKMTHSLNDCINSQVHKAEHYVEDALNRIKKIKKDLKISCHGNVLKKAKCLAKLVPRILRDVERVPQHIIEDATKATALVTNIIPVMEACVTHHVAKAVEDATKDIAGFAKCAGV